MNKHRLAAMLRIWRGKPTIYGVEFVPGPKWVNFMKGTEVVIYNSSFTGFVNVEGGPWRLNYSFLDVDLKDDAPIT